MKIDLITGLLGAGKTTFIKWYAEHFLNAGLRICILASDYGAISIDRAVLAETFGDRCDVEMITAADPDCYRRRFKTKLIAMGMSGYDRVIVEPSGVFDADEFFDLLYEAPLDRWYEVGSILCIVDAGVKGLGLTPTEEYLLVSEAASAGKIVLSKVGHMNVSKMTQIVREDENAATLQAELLSREIAGYLKEIGNRYHCSRLFGPSQIIASDFLNGFSDDVFAKLSKAEYVRADIMKLPSEGIFRNLFYYTIQKSSEEMTVIAKQLLSDAAIYGKVIRIKGFFHDPDSDAWFEMNAVRERIEIKPAAAEKECVIVIGMGLVQSEVNRCFGETRSVTDYQI